MSVLTSILPLAAAHERRTNEQTGRAVAPTTSGGSALHAICRTDLQRAARWTSMDGSHLAWIKRVCIVLHACWQIPGSWRMNDSTPRQLRRTNLKWRQCVSVVQWLSSLAAYQTCGVFLERRSKRSPQKTSSTPSLAPDRCLTKIQAGIAIGARTG